jgi:hypothetical protein
MRTEVVRCYINLLLFGCSYSESFTGSMFKKLYRNASRLPGIVDINMDKTPFRLTTHASNEKETLRNGDF